MNKRIEYISKILNNPAMIYKSLLDVGCRDCSLSKGLKDKDYSGCDLFQNDTNSVEFVGDILSINFDKKFDCVVALDIIEHVDDPYTLVDKFFDLSNKFVVLSLPNIYDLKHKYNFLINNTLGSKYYFRTKNSLDRHRWIMNYDEIINFYKFYAEKYNLEYEIKTLNTGYDNTKLSTKVILNICKLFISKKTLTSTVICIFRKK